MRRLHPTFYVILCHVHGNVIPSDLMRQAWDLGATGTVLSHKAKDSSCISTAAEPCWCVDGTSISIHTTCDQLGCYRSTDLTVHGRSTQAATMLWKASQLPGKNHGNQKKTWLRKIAGSSRPHLGIACRKGMGPGHRFSRLRGWRSTSCRGSLGGTAYGFRWPHKQYQTMTFSIDRQEEAWE